MIWWTGVVSLTMRAMRCPTEVAWEFIQANPTLHSCAIFFKVAIACASFDRLVWFYWVCKFCAVCQKQLKIYILHRGRSKTFPPSKKGRLFSFKLDLIHIKPAEPSHFFYQLATNSTAALISYPPSKLTYWANYNLSLTPDKKCFTSCFSVTSTFYF